MTTNRIAPGVWPTMLTPFTDSLQIDFSALASLVEWYIAKGVDGLFAVCQSSEMFFLETEEREALAAFVVKQAAGRVPVIASGHVSDSLEQQLEEIRLVSDTGIDAFVLVTNRLAAAEESDDVWIKRASVILDAFPHMSFGMYECPYPYKRLLSEKLIDWCAASGRFSFLKDTCCDPAILQDRVRRCSRSGLQLFNANSATLLHSLRLGYAGFSGVMANFHPELYVDLVRNWQVSPGQAESLQNFLGFSSVLETQNYSLNAKYYLQLEGVPLLVNSRAKRGIELTASQRLEVEQFRSVSQAFPVRTAAPSRAADRQ